LRLDDVAMIAADTSRSRAYLQALVRHDLLPSRVLLLQAPAGQTLPGQLRSATAGEPLAEMLEHAGVGFEAIDNADVNHPSVVERVRAARESVFIYSGYGGVLLKAPLFDTGKRFLHVHGGYLPDFKGSTANYYSLLVDGSIAASALFLSPAIDSGPVLRRRKFPAPLDRRAIDHVADSAARAEVLVETLEAYVKAGRWQFELAENEGGRTYYVIHPVLKHLAILATR
jgi:methionyl-tRNA formyltransferase